MLLPQIVKPLIDKLEPDTYTALMVYYGILYTTNITRHIYSGSNDSVRVDREALAKDFQSIEENFKALFTAFESERVSHLFLEASALICVIYDWDVQVSLNGLGGCVLKSPEENLIKNGFVLNEETGKYSLPPAKNDPVHFS
jgi:hypothetical protein